VPLWSRPDHSRRRAGDKVRWQRYAGIFHRDLGDGEHADIIVADRIYRVRTAELS